MPKKIHILYTIPNFDTAGSGKVVYDLVKHLDKDRFKVSIACRHDKGAFFKDIASLGVPIHFMDITVPLRPYYSLFHRLQPYRAFLKREQVDVVHSWHWSSDWSEPLACWLQFTPFVYTKKSMGWGSRHWKIRSYLSRFIITVNLEMRSFFPNIKQQRLIPFGLDTNHYNPEGFLKDAAKEPFKIITVANLVPVKNLEFLLHAVHGLKHLNLHLEIVGDTRNAYAEDLKQLVNELQLESQVSFLGTQADVRPLLANADLYVIPSKQEGMPMALVEAMAMAVPVLGSDIPGIRYVLQDFEHLLFDVSDIEALSAKIEWLYLQSPSERQALGAALHDYCVEHFSLEAFIAAHEDLYLELVTPTS